MLQIILIKEGIVAQFLPRLKSRVYLRVLHDDIFKDFEESMQRNPQFATMILAGVTVAVIYSSLMKVMNKK